MRKVVAICQPNFMPWLGYFEMAERADVFVMLDDVQYIDREWVNRNKILSATSQGWQWITVPLKKHKREILIKDAEIYNDESWNEVALKTIHHIYHKAPYYETYMPGIRDVLSKKWDRLAHLNIALIRALYAVLGIKDNLMLSSDIGVPEKKDDKLSGIASRLGATVYLANNGSKTYIDASKFHARNIGFVFQDYVHPEYSVKQYTFKPYLSCIDLVFWHGPDSMAIITKGRKEHWESSIEYPKDAGKIGGIES
ncbi:MAG: WbqC family protein [Candidatus Omnitrophica bacterium]|nr:WbqC family protein [Candidatus Omnitrophota bacterium]